MTASDWDNIGDEKGGEGDDGVSSMPEIDS